jgi:hypothetical protein
MVYENMTKTRKMPFGIKLGGDVMNKLILTVLMLVMLTVPSKAEVEPAGLFGVEGTYWEEIPIFEGQPTYPLDIAFSGGKIYGCIDEYSCNELTSISPSSHTDFFLLTLFNINFCNISALTINGILIPFLGLGWGSALHGLLPKSFYS